MKMVKTKNTKKNQWPDAEMPARSRPRGAEFEEAATAVPKPSKEGAAYTFVVDRSKFNLWVKALKLRYWMDFGSRDEFNVKWDCEKNKSGVMLKRLVRVFRVEEAEEALLFAITCFDSHGKVMVQGNHRELWVDNEFPILNNIVDGLKKEDKDVSDLYKQSAGIELELTSEDLVLSEDEAGNKNEETTAVNKRQLVEIEDGDSNFESDSTSFPGP